MAYQNELATQLQAMMGAQGDQGPNFLGLQSAVDPQRMQSVLEQIQQQQAAAELPQYAGQRDLYQGGQQLGNLISNAIARKNAPANAGPSARDLQNAAIQKAQVAYQTLLTNGQDEGTARLAAAKIMAEGGVPGSTDLIAKITEQQLKDQNTQSEIQNRTLTQAETARHNKVTEDTSKGQLAVARLRAQIEQDKAKGPSGEDLDAAARAVANYDANMADALGRGAKADVRNDFIAKVKAIRPDWDAKNYQISQRNVEAFTKGRQGDQARFNVNVQDHLNTLMDLHNAIKAGNVVKANELSQAVATQLSDPSLAAFNAANSIVAPEITKAIVPNAGTATERAHNLELLKASIGSPAFSATVKAQRRLLTTQYNNLKNVYEKSTYRKDFGDLYQLPQFSEDQGAQAPASSGWGTAQKVN